MVDFFGIAARRTAKALVSRANQEVDQLDSESVKMKVRNQALVELQVQFWSIDRLDPNQEHEYRKVAEEIAYIAKARVAIYDYLKPLRLARYHCREDGDCAELAGFAYRNPLQDLQADIKPVFLDPN